MEIGQVDRVLPGRENRNIERTSLSLLAAVCILLIPAATQAVTALSVQKNQFPASGSILNAGDAIRYQIVVANVGDATITDLRVTDTLAAEVTQLTTAQDDTRFTVAVTQAPGGGTRYVWSNTVAQGLALEPGQVFTFTVTGVAGSVCTAIPRENTAVADGRSWSIVAPMVVSPAVSFTGQPHAVGVSIVKSQLLPLTATVSTGVPVRYQIVVTNTGAATLSDLIVVDTLQVELEAVTATAPGLVVGLPTNLAGGGTRWVWGGAGLAFLPGTTMTITIDAKTGSVAGLRSVSNTAFVAAANACGLVATGTSSPATGFDIDPANPTVAVAVIQTPPSGSILQLGDKIVYTIVVVNTSGATLDNITVTDTIAAEVTLQSAQQDSSLFAVAATSVASGTRYEWRNIIAGGLTFGPGQTFSFTVTGYVGHVCSSTVRDDYAVAEGSSLGVTAPTVVSPLARLRSNPLVPGVTVVHTVSPALPLSGGPVNYSIMVTNTGAETLSNLELTDTIPPVAQFTATQTGGDVVPVVAGSLYDWTLGALVPGETRTLSISGVAGDCYTGIVSSTAMLTGDTPCSYRITQLATAFFPLQAPAPNLTVWADFFADDPTRTLHTQLPQMGMPIYWKLVVANTGGKPADDIIIVDSLPSLDASIDKIEIPANGMPASLAYPTPVLADSAPTSTVFFTTTGTGGLLLAVLGGSGFSLQPGESVTLYMDMTLKISDVGSRYVVNAVQATITNPCTGSRLATPPILTVIGWGGCGVTVTVKVSNTSGEIVRRFDPFCVSRPPSRLDFGYTATGSCASWTGDLTEPFSPDGDCHNDLLKFVFPELFIVFGQPFDRIWWDGKNNQGYIVPNGTYTVNVDSVDIQTGAPIILQRTIEVLVGPSPRVDGWKVPYGKLVIAPNVLDRRSIQPNVQFGMRGKANGTVEIRIWDEAGSPVRTIAVTLDGQGAGVVLFDGRGVGGAVLGPGLYWVTATGSGVSDRQGFMVAGRRGR
ncbi:MAG: hypothetical protein AAB152_03380 [Candidatus Coatesbacteria bacterium]